MRSLLADARAVAEALFASEEGPPPAERLDWLEEELADLILEGGARVRLVVEGGVFAATWLAPPLVSALPPLSRLDIPKRAEALDRLERTPAGMPLFALKAMLCILYYEHADVLREIGVAEGEGDRPGCLVEPTASAGGAS